MVVDNLVQYWDQEILPSEIEKLTETWRIMNPSMSHTIFSKKSAREYIDDNYGTFATELFLSAKLPAMQSDIFRVAYCLRDGGFYADAASRCHASIEPLIESIDNLLLMRRLKGTICNGFIATQKNNPILFHFWAKITRNIFLKDINKVWIATGPGAYKDALQLANDSTYTIVDEADMREKYFKLVGGLPHKKHNHWTATEKTESIFYD